MTDYTTNDVFSKTIFENQVQLNWIVVPNSPGTQYNFRTNALGEDHQAGNWMKTHDTF